MIVSSKTFFILFIFKKENHIYRILSKNFNVGLYLDIYKLSSVKVGMMTETIELCSLIPV